MKLPVEKAIPTVAITNEDRSPNSGILKDSAARTPGPFNTSVMEKSPLIGSDNINHHLHS